MKFNNILSTREKSIVCALHWPVITSDDITSYVISTFKSVGDVPAMCFTQCLDKHVVSIRASRLQHANKLACNALSRAFCLDALSHRTGHYVLLNHEGPEKFRIYF